MQSLCKKKCETFKSQIVLTVPQFTVAFWTDDLPVELIAIATFIKSNDGKVVYGLDYSQITL